MQAMHKIALSHSQWLLVICCLLENRRKTDFTVNYMALHKHNC